MTNQISLVEIELKTRVKVVDISLASKVRRRIMDMGIVKGTEIVVIGKAPMGDPIELQVRGYSLSLRKSEARDIMVKLI
ncbi:ferrous iron transport protein A [Clostridium sp. CM028]|uniref:FeoA family protein n=1 Tax=Clostridium TaxID=1485 RepID=UPI0013EE7030|nr:MULTISPECIES: ferrous iron transport protein A [Clostridium]MBU3091676.1 ferrous iron transport protein A [Clostridium sp. CF011]MBW9144824.1 ferrous iron transport protein A [Clostridium sp. CM027]MBW9149292.1 ferrous iron transport protein A [Clostridium sp. CM028]MBZ9609293.1 ferrous iron transport protein A [Clostridium estertheticum]UVE40432.1 ferrous iron transport protein A [Clostridium sp. CM027]